MEAIADERRTRVFRRRIAVLRLTIKDTQRPKGATAKTCFVDCAQK